MAVVQRAIDLSCQLCGAPFYFVSYYSYGYNVFELFVVVQL